METSIRDTALALLAKLEAAVAVVEPGDAMALKRLTGALKDVRDILAEGEQVQTVQLVLEEALGE